MKIYLETVIFVYAESKSLILSKLEDIIGSKIDSIFYSASHFQEALEIKGDNKQHPKDRINKSSRNNNQFSVL